MIAKKTVGGSKETSGDAEIIAAPGSEAVIYLVAWYACLDNPAESVDVTIKSNDVDKITLPLSSDVPGFAHALPLVMEPGQELTLELSAAVKVWYSFSYVVTNA